MPTKKKMPDSSQKNVHEIIMNVCDGLVDEAISHFFEHGGDEYRRCCDFLQKGGVTLENLQDLNNRGALLKVMKTDGPARDVLLRIVYTLLDSLIEKMPKSCTCKCSCSHCTSR